MQIPGNKTRITALVLENFINSGFDIIQSGGDANRNIVKAAVDKAGVEPMCIIGDMDLLVLMTT